MKVALTGSSGFIGTHVLNALNKKKCGVIPIDLTEGYDLLNWESISNTSHFDYLIHLAARTFVPDAFDNPRVFYKSNILTTLNALELCRRENARMVYISSYVYGEPLYLPIDEKHPTLAHNPYAESKLIGEELCQAYARDFSLSGCIFRPFNVYGPGQKEQFLIPNIFKQAKTGRVNLLSPEPKRDFIYVTDVVSAIMASMSMDNSGMEIFNLGFGVSTSVRKLTTLIQQIFPEIEISFSGEIRTNEISNTVANIGKAKDILNWSPLISIDNGLKLMES